MLRFLQLLSGLGQGEKCDAIDFWKTLNSARSRRPFELKLAALERPGLAKIAAESPGMNSLATFLADGAEIDEIAMRFDTGFLPELAYGRGKQILP